MQNFSQIELELKCAPRRKSASTKSSFRFLANHSCILRWCIRYQTIAYCIQKEILTRQVTKDYWQSEGSHYKLYCTMYRTVLNFDKGDYIGYFFTTDQRFAKG